MFCYIIEHHTAKNAIGIVTAKKMNEERSRYVYNTLEFEILLNQIKKTPENNFNKIQK